MVGTANVVVSNGFGSGIFDALIVPNGFPVRFHTLAPALLEQNQTQGKHTDSQRPDAVALTIVQRGVFGHGQIHCGLPAVQCYALFL